MRLCKGYLHKHGSCERIVFPENPLNSECNVIIFQFSRKKIQTLPPDLRAEAIHYIDELVKRSKKRSSKTFRCAAEGTLADLGARYSSVDLQHKALEWRGA